MLTKFYTILAFLSIVVYISSFQVRRFKQSAYLLTKLQMADVEITFPNGKKAKVAAGSALKDAAKKAGFSPNYGCEEGL
jgi:hypothetical protein